MTTGCSTKGTVATVGVTALSLVIVRVLPPHFLTTWATLGMVAMIPMQMIVGIMWQSQFPTVIGRFPQPWRGLLYLLLTAVIGSLVAAFAFYQINGGVAPPAPFAIMFLILTVPTAVWLIIGLQGWPFTIWFRPVGAGFATLSATYLIAYTMYETLLNFNFLADAPFYKAILNPGGRFTAWGPSVLGVILSTTLLALTQFEFWPMTLFPGHSILSRQPCFGLLATVLAGMITAVTWYTGMVVMRMNWVELLVQIAVPGSFGIFVLMVTMEGSVFGSIRQPLRGLLLSVVTVAIAMVSYKGYQSLCVELFGLHQGRPDHAQELWIASAMLAITFPMMVFYANYFQFWPIGSAFQGASKKG